MVQILPPLFVKMIDIKIILVSVIIIEMITLIGRFVFKIKVKNIYKKRLKKIPRIHHFFTGLIIFIIGYYYKNVFFTSFGLGVSLSDIIHHCILKIVTGSFELK
jgi:hypothetical protein